jgi:Ca2+-binding EF-hand superfamily protein
MKVPTERELWHGNIDKQQKKAIQINNQGKISADTTISLHVMDALIRSVDELQNQIEMDSTLSGQGKIKYLRSVDFLLQGFLSNLNRRDYPASLAPALIKAFGQCMVLDKQHKSFGPIIESNEYGVGKILMDCLKYSEDNPGMAGARITLMRKYLTMHPDQIMPELVKNPNAYFADSLIKEALKADIGKVYDYAQANNALGDRIRHHSDSVVQLVARIATSKSGQLYFPFLDNLMRGSITLQAIDSVKGNDLGYFRLLVKTRIEYVQRSLPPYNDTANQMQALTDMMARKAKEYFIREINALHTLSNDNVRFRRLDGLTPQELYYLAVLGEDEIYTSSYVRGVYPRIWQRMAKGDSLIMSVHGDYFRKFIKMAAGYNELNDFLGKMDKQNAETMMKAFVIGLEKPRKTHDLEDAVDVADSYSSIMDKNRALADFILNEVNVSYTKNVQENNKRGVVIYNLMRILFESADTTKKIDLSTLLGIPSIYGKDYSNLTDDSGRVIQQVFFYGDEDKDGQTSYANFMTMFRGRPGWRIDERRAEWVSITSTKGKPVLIFANKPLYGENDPDDKAQDKLIEYLHDRNLTPTVVIHRGHSYHLQTTLHKLPSSARIIVLGSCGGYNNLNEVLTACPDAHIISSKQVGTKRVNEPILQAINDRLLVGKNIDWISMWRELKTKKFATGDAKEMFDDYIPPYKNLGAIFIKAYRKAMGE